MRQGRRELRQGVVPGWCNSGFGEHSAASHRGNSDDGFVSRAIGRDDTEGSAGHRDRHRRRQEHQDRSRCMGIRLRRRDAGRRPCADVDARRGLSRRCAGRRCAGCLSRRDTRGLRRHRRGVAATRGYRRDLIVAVVDRRGHLGRRRACLGGPARRRPRATRARPRLSQCSGTVHAVYEHGPGLCVAAQLERQHVHARHRFHGDG